MQLIGPQFESLVEAIGNAFDYDSLERCLRLKLARKLDHIVAVPQRLPDVIFDLLDTANREGWVEELLKALTDYNAQGELHAAIQGLFTAPSVARFLDGQTYRALAEGIRRDLRSEDFRQLVRGLGRDFDPFGGGEGDIATVFAALYTSVREGWIDPLVQQLAERKDKAVGTLAAALLAGDAERIESVERQVAARDADTWQEFVTRPEVVNRETLKRLSGGFNAPEVVHELARVSRWVCLIKTKIGVSTGFLVGPDLVLTCNHCVSDLHGNPAGSGGAYCHFDVRTLTDGTTTSAGTAVPFARDEWLLDSDQVALPASDESDSDAMAMLNYAVIKLARAVGTDPVDGNVDHRGWFSLRPLPKQSVADPIFVLSHPEGGPLKLSAGNLRGWDSTGTRLIHDATTIGGSSGAPCLNDRLEVIGVHERRFTTTPTPIDEPRKGAVCIDSIVQRIEEHARARGVAPFWEQTPSASEET